MRATVCTTWSDGLQVVCALPRKQKSGKYPIHVPSMARLITAAIVDIDNLIDRERLVAHCQAQDGAVAWLPRFVQIGEDLSTLQGPQRTIEILQLSTVTPVRVEFWWKPYLPKGSPVAIEGDPGVGKSTLVLKIVAHLTSGRRFPMSMTTPRRRVTSRRATSVSSPPKMIRATPFCPGSSPTAAMRRACISLPGGPSLMASGAY